MYNKSTLFWCSFLCVFFESFLFVACSKKEYQDVLKTVYEPKAEPTELYDEFTVQLKGSALQKGETGTWSITKGTVVEDYVKIDDPNNPNSFFRGVPGEEYILTWTVKGSGNSNTATVDVKIPELHIDIKENTPSSFKTILHFAVDPKYKGKWSFDKAYGHLHSTYHDGWARPVEENPTIELHGYSNTSYQVTYTMTYAGKNYQFTKKVQTGEYQEDEALNELQMGRGGRVVEDKDGHIIEINMQASGIAHRFNEPDFFPALKAFKYLRKLILGGSSLKDVPTIFGDHYLALEELSLDRVGYYLTIPDNFGNLTKLKSFHLTPMRTPDLGYTVVLPTTFGNLKSLENLIMRYVGDVDFNGTLGKLANLKHLDCFVTQLPSDFGNLTKLVSTEVLAQQAYIPSSLSQCRNLRFARFSFVYPGSSPVTLPSDIDNLTKLDTLEIYGESRLQQLPQSFGNLKSLKQLWIQGESLQSIPDNIGNLSNLRFWLVGGNFKTLPASIGNLKKLEDLWLSPSVEKLPDEFGGLSSLSYLNMENSRLTTLPETFGKLKSLKEINARASSITDFPSSFGQLDGLLKLDFNYSKLKKFPVEICALKAVNNVILNGTNLGRLPDEIYTMRSGVIFTLYQCLNMDYDQLKEITAKRDGLVFYY